MNYESADTTFIVNDGDPDLTPTRFSLPFPPPLELIDGYGLPAEKQRFKRLEIPMRLKQLEQKVMDVLNKKADTSQFVITYYYLSKEFWDTLDRERDSYKEEIKFIKKVWWYRLNGYWFFNHGKPTYITGWHFMYLNFWFMSHVKPDQYPHYRDRDRREYLHHHYAYTTTETFAKLDDAGWAIPEEDGSYKMIDMGRRTCYGLGQPKNRRSGNTNKGLCINTEIVTRTIGTDGAGIISYTGANAEKHFKGKVVPAWNNFPLFLRPFCTSKLRPQSLVLDVHSSDFKNKGLGTTFTYADSADAKAYDGLMLVSILCDEEGKTSRSEADVDERNRVLVNCLSQGNGMIIHGYCYHPSTVDEYVEGGFAFRNMMNASSFYQRVKASGQTPSGLFRLFMSGEEALDGFIDSYGFSVRGTIKDYQKKEGFKQTSDEYLTGIKEHFLKQDTPEANEAYRSQRKLFPQRWADCWIGEAGEIGFDIGKIDDQITEIRRRIALGDKPTIKGNFEWKNDIFGEDVEFVPDDEGRFEVSDLARDRANKRIRDVMWDAIDQMEKEVWTPYDPLWGTAGGDPFRFKKKAEVKYSYSKHSMSDGGFCVVKEYDQKIDGTRPRSEWESVGVVCTYRYRPKTDDEFTADCLKACIWYGVHIYPEMNFEIIYKNFRQWGYGGYLKHDILENGQMKDEPGTRLYTQSKQAGFSYARNFINYHCKNIWHLELLMECKLITNMDDLQNYDLLASFMCALIGSKSKYSQIVKQGEVEVNIKGLFELLGYNY